MATDITAQGLAIRALKATAPATVREAIRPYAAGTTLQSGFPPLMATPPTISYGQYRGASAVAIVNGGTGYAVGNVLTVTGGSGLVTATKIYVVAVSGGVITNASIHTAGFYSGGSGGVPSNAVSVTGGAGSGATFNLTYANGSANNKVFGGSIYGGGNAVFRPTGTAYGPLSGGYGNTIQPYADVIIDFWSDSAAPTLNFITSTHSIMVFVDGERVRDTVFGGSASGDNFYVALDWGGVRKNRRYSIRGINVLFEGVRVETSESVWYPSEAPLNLGYFFGDSYVNLTGSNGPGKVFYDAVGRVLGIRVMGAGSGGTGWKSTSPDTLGRIQNAVNNLNVAPWAFFIPFGYNDADGTGGSTIQTKCYSVLETIALKFPSTKIFLISPWTPLGNTANLTYVATYMKAAFDAFVAAYPGTWARWIDISTVVTANNKSLYTGGDNTHPAGDAGSMFLGDRIGQLCAAQIWP